MANIGVAVTLRVSDEDRGEVLTALKSLVSESLREPGCLRYDLHCSQEGTAAEIFLYERYVDEAALDAHRESPHFQHYFLEEVLPKLTFREAHVYESLEAADQRRSSSSGVTAVAAVIGGGSGIGAATAKALGADSAWVAVADQDYDAAADVANEIVRAKGNALAFQLDVSSRGKVSEFIRSVSQLRGRLDILVVTAGHLEMKPIESLDEAVVGRMLDVHLKGVIFATQAVLPIMKQQGYGRIVCVASTAAYKGTIDHHHYAAAKAGIIGFVKSASKELATHGININVVVPGAIDTPMIARVEHTGSIERSIPVGRLGRPEEVADAIAFLASKKASYICGAALTISGGEYT